MKEKTNVTEWYNTKLVKEVLLYLIFTLLFVIYREIFGFELAVIIILGQIMGEIKSNNKPNINK